MCQVCVPTMRFLIGEQEKDLKEERKKRRKTRWGGSEHDKTFIPGMPTVLPTNLTPEQEKAYLCKLPSSHLIIL